MPFSKLENVFGFLGLALVVFIVALFFLPTDWGQLWQQASRPQIPSSEWPPTYFFYAISLIGAAVVPYQVIFFSSGGRVEQWTTKSIDEMRLNALVGFPLGGILSIAIMAAMVPVLQPLQVNVAHLGQVALPVSAALGVVGLSFALLGFAAATFAAGAESALSTGYQVAQYFGWKWGKCNRPAQAGRFCLVSLATVILGAADVLSTIDPITVTIVSVTLGVAAIPLTYFPVLVVANERAYMGKYANGKFADTLGVLFLVVLTVTPVATLPLRFLTKAGR